MMSVSVISWWAFLCTVAVLNVIAWSVSAAAFVRRRPLLSRDALTLRRFQLVLSAVYVFGCAFRSAFPVYDIPRICLFNSWLSSVIVGRSIATLAELCFVAQWAVMLREAGRVTGNVFVQRTSRVLLPLIAVAEICSWYSVLTTSNLGHIAEESIWAVCAALLVASILVLLPRFTGALRRVLQAACVVGVGYVAYMVFVDVPMYLSRWLADEAGGRHYLSLAQGVLDASDRWKVSYRWVDWKNEIAWMSIYFSVAVWFSIALIHTPMPRALGTHNERSRAEHV